MIEYKAQNDIINSTLISGKESGSTDESLEQSLDSLSSYQFFQRQHDLAYHHDIMVLGISRQMSHVTLHLIKYLNALSSKHMSDPENKRSFVDSFIMTISASNLLGISLSKIDLLEPVCLSDESFISVYIKILSDLAKACEASDHQEDYPIRQVWHTSIKKFFRLLMQESIRREILILDEAVSRLEYIERKHSLYNIISKKI